MSLYQNVCGLDRLELFRRLWENVPKEQAKFDDAKAQDLLKDSHVHIDRFCGKPIGLLFSGDRLYDIRYFIYGNKMDSEIITEYREELTQKKKKKKGTEKPLVALTTLTDFFTQKKNKG